MGNSIKKGIYKLGYVKNAKKNESGENFISFLSKIVGRNISLSELNDFVESDNCILEYYDEKFNRTSREFGLTLKFKTPFQNRRKEDIYGVFTRKSCDDSFWGVNWESAKSLSNYGTIHPNSITALKELTSNNEISENDFKKYIIDESFVYINGAGHNKFPNGDEVNEANGKFVIFKTKLSTHGGKKILGWFTKNTKGKYEGIDWGTEEDFQTSRKNRELFFVGRMTFDSIEECNSFLEKLAKKTIEEPWNYKNKKDENFKYPILKSYLQFELERLFWEHDELKYPNKLIYNNNKDKVLFNTNLIDKFGHDLNIMGDILTIGGKEYITNLDMSPSMLTLKKYGFMNFEPIPPKFFDNINEIVFHCEWDIDQSIDKYEHIIEDRIERFPSKYRELETDELGIKLDNAIEFAKKIAQRNYKFIVPMYYPSKRRIQLLMPMYLENSYSSHPDFALVLTPHSDEKLYTPETILGLDEVYQDARLVAKPEESWLNPEMIE